jgi:hypothetical protein
MPYLMKYMLDNKVGTLPYPSQLDDRRYVDENEEIKYAEIRQYYIRERVAEIDNRKQMLAQIAKKKKLKTKKEDMSPSRKLMEAQDDLDGSFEYSDQKKKKGPWRFKLEDNLGQLDNSSDSEERNLKLLKKEEDDDSENEDQDEGERLDNPDIYFGDVAKDSFWDFFKSDRKFKDFNYKDKEIEDPR